MNIIVKSLATLALALLLGTGAAHMAGVTQVSSQSAADLAATNAPASPEKFDGRTLYKSAFESLRDYHIELADIEVRAQWVQQWQNKFEKTASLQTPEGTDQAIESMILSLNQRFDHYQKPEEKRQTREQIDSSLVGIGVQLTLKDLDTGLLRRSSIETLTVSEKHPLVVGSVVESGPAQKAGLKEGDIIQAIGNQPLKGKNMSQVLSSIRGTRGSSITLTIERTIAGRLQTLVINVTRDTVVNPVVHYKELGTGIAYVRLDHFLSKHAVSEMAAALKKAAKQTGLVLDLRHNPGGDLQAAVAITAMLLPEGTIVELKSRDGNKLITERASVLKNLQILEAPDTNNAMQTQAMPRTELIIPRKMPVVVLVNEQSASAAELLSGALQKSGRATVVGAPTMGKGVGQAVIDLPFDRTIGVTNFEFLPAAESIDWVGIIPDINAPTATGVAFGDPRDKQHSAAVQVITELLERSEKLARVEQRMKRIHKQEFESQNQEQP